MKCPFCAFETGSRRAGLQACSRDIVTPASVIAERDDLVRKLASAREELLRTREEIKALTRRGKGGER